MKKKIENIERNRAHGSAKPLDGPTAYTNAETDSQETEIDFLIGTSPVVVGIAASAGSLEILKQFFKLMPTDSGLCFIVVMHLSRDWPSMLPEILVHCTPMAVLKAEVGMALLPNSVFLLPVDKELTIRHGKFQLSGQSLPNGISHVIDRFFCSLATELSDRLIAVILSGAGSDGAQGAVKVKAGGGILIVQEPETAMYSGMPVSAIATGAANMILPVAEMPEKIIEFSRRSDSNMPLMEQAVERDEQFATILRLLKTKTGHDFSSYKKDTILRRLQRRMAINEVNCLADYAALLLKTPQEADALYKDILIGVTSFFRDPDAFITIQKKVIPQLFSDRNPSDTVRIWHPCCASGEEVYSMAILIQEYLRERQLTTKVQFFGTDLDDGGVALARAGIFPLSISANISKDRLETWFTRIGNHYQVVKKLREMIIFAHHSLIKDPPFSQLDLVVCRNFLIYLNVEMQQKLICLFHQVLKPGGFLFLGSSETVGRHVDLFTIVNKKWKIFNRQKGICKSEMLLPFYTPVTTLPRMINFSHPGRLEKPSVTDSVENDLKERFFPPCAVVNEKYEVIYSSNLTSRFLVQQVGEPTRDILKIVRKELRPTLRVAIHKTIVEQKQTEFGRIKVAADCDEMLVNIKVDPIQATPTLKLAVVVFELVALSQAYTVGHTIENDQLPDDDVSKNALIRHMDYQLRTTQEQLQASIEQLESSNAEFTSLNEELITTNEELQSTNEELQSTNEELETSKEELQTLNEELGTVNAELRDKVEELDQTNTDMNNLFTSSEVASIFLDRQLIIKRFSPAMAAFIDLIPADIGRPFRHMTGTFDFPDLANDAKEVLEKLTTVERELAAPEKGKFFMMRVLPYRTMEGQAAGIVVTLVDITARKLAEEHTRHLASFPQLNPNPILEVNSSGCIIYSNPALQKVLEGLEMTEADANIFLPADLDFILRDLENKSETSFYRETVIKNRIFGGIIHIVPQSSVVRIYVYDITENKRAEDRLDLLAETAGELLKAKFPQQVVERLCRKVMSFLDCDVFLIYLADRQSDRLHLIASAGIPNEESRRIEWLEYGGGCAARDFCTLVAENVGESCDPKTELIKTYGIKSYACHPLTIQDRVIGTLSFGTHNRTCFTDDELSLMKAITYQVAIAMDRMQSGEALRESEMRYRGLFDHMLEGFAYCRMIFEDGEAQDFIYLAVNDAFNNLTGLEDVVGKRVTEVIPDIKESDAELFQLYGNVARGGEPTRVEIFVKAMDMWFAISIYCPEKGYFVAIFDVITNRKRAEESLRKSEERYERIAATVPAVLYDYALHADGTSQFLYLSPRCSEIFGLEAEAFLNDMTLFWNMIHPDDLAKVHGEEMAAQGAQGAFSKEVRIVTPSGLKKWIQLTAQPNPTGSEETVVWSGVILDITERKRSEEERDKSERLESLGVLAGGIAHDFNNILFAMIGNISVARQRVGTEHAAATQLAACEKALVKATGLTRQLLTFARGGAPAKENLDTERLIQEVASFALHGSNSKVDIDLAQGLWRLNADIGQIHQALNNLIINALQSMPDGGIINIKAINQTIGSDEVESLPAGNYVKITVTDQGCGIPQEILSRIFDPYFTTKPTGTGLGLASVFSIVKRHGGTIEVLSKLGKGSTFTLLLPAPSEKTDDEIFAYESGDTVPAPLSDMPVLVMDDEEMIRELVAEMLTTLGYKGITCADGTEAVSLYREHWAKGEPFAAVILDMTIPGGMGGKEAAKQILNIDPGAILITSSGYDAESDLTAGTNAFFRGVISKPYNVQKLSQELARLIKLR